MSIINEALKKANREKENIPVGQSQESAKKNLGMELEKKRARVNWGPVFVLLVLFLITGPIIAPIFSTPFKRGSFSSYYASATADRVNQSPNGAQMAVAARSETSLNRRAQFAIEEAPVFHNVAPQNPQPPPLSLSGIVYSPTDAYCIINNKIVKTGEEVQGARLVKITAEEVVLDYQGEKIILSNAK